MPAFYIEFNAHVSSIILVLSISRNTFDNPSSPQPYLCNAVEVSQRKQKYKISCSIN